MELEVVRTGGRERLRELGPLFEAARHADGHEPLGEHKVLDLTHGGNDCFRGILARRDGKVTAYGHLSRHGHRRFGLELVVHPEHRGEGLAEVIARRALDIAREAGGGHVVWWVFRPDPSADELARRLGLTRDRDLLHMLVDLPVGARPELPEGVRLRAFRPGRDEDAWLEVNNRAFVHHPEQGGWDRAMLLRRLAEPWFDPEGFLLAVGDDDRIAGFCWTKIKPDCGEIYVIGVDPPHQGGGLGRALTLAGLDYMARRGARRGCLYVDAAQAPAISMYRRLGFEVDHLDRSYAGDV